MTHTTAKPVLKSGKKSGKRNFPPSEATVPNQDTEQDIAEISRNLATGNKNQSIQPRVPLIKLTSRIQPELDLWLKQTPPEFKARFGRKIKQETLVQIAIRLLKDNPKAMDVIDELTK